ncbi:3'-5' exonuclease [Thetidibacter halocola]|uniref:DNA-directed DNA polymerase n=1 Tax=Thetidibacter halocola TaxID=2827239 RepID=A0A8J8BB96_9RHOB|nr:3'-5' exonuclease [Thetidibacter halocola]MBS0126003.1 3'-5' exonuclease [Thetidibacter halocola]
MTRLSLRLRVFLFFVLLAAGGVSIVLGALYAGHARAQETDPATGFVFAGTLSLFGLVGLTTAIWFLFDENVAKPIQRLATSLRARAHAGAGQDLDLHSARYLGDLAPAARAVASALSDSAMQGAQRLASETARIEAEKARLTALLTEIPVATLLADAQGRIVLYDGQAAEVLAQQGVPRLGAALSEYFDAGDLSSARQRLAKKGKEVSAILRGQDGRQTYDIRLRPLDGGATLMVIDAAHVEMAPDAARPLVFDFDLMGQSVPEAVEETPLRQLVFTVFDTETTGLLPHKDEIVQIGAVRIVNSRLVPGETIDQLVDPGRPIPPASTAVHHVSDAMVAGKPDIVAAGRKLHDFARGSVIVAHNAPFDMAFLRRHGARMQRQWDHPILDTVLVSAVLFGTTETHTLDALCLRLGVTIPPELRHTAMGDARATAEVLLRMLPMLEAQGVRTFGQLLEETRKHGRLLKDMN